MFQTGYTKTYRPDHTAFANAQIGYAPAIGSICTQNTTLRYLSLTWCEVEPERGQYAWDSIDKQYGLSPLREQGIHLVLRFVCDLPGTRPHLDIPGWLYDQTHDGSWYNTSYGKGYSPNYSNPILLAAHHAVIQALADYFDDGFVAYVELGSLGHWGEWHIKSGEGLVPMPEESIRDQYAADYLSAFFNAKLLMRRPFNITKQNALGLYNDMAGSEPDTNEWFGWIQNGGWYGTESHALSAMPDFWKDVPAGGEFTSGLSMDELLRTNLPRTLELIQRSHMSFLGPLTADETFHHGYSEVLKALGYRLRVTQMQLVPIQNGTFLTLTFFNEGTAPFYWNWPLNLYLETADGKTLRRVSIPFDFSGLLPGEQKSIPVLLESIDFYTLLSHHTPQLTLGIVDPMTNRDAVRFAMQTEQRNGRAILWK